MAVTTALSRNVRKIGAAIRKYAASVGVDQDHVAIAGVLARNNERIYVDVGVDRPIDQHAWYIGIQEALASELGSIPSFVQLGIVIQQVADLNTFYDEIPVGDDDLDLTDWLSPHG